MRKYNEEEYKSALESKVQWKVIKWLIDQLSKCQDVDSITDIDAARGTMSFITPEGDEYTMIIKNGSWRDI